VDLSKLLTEEERKEIADRKTAARPAMTEGGRRIVMVVAVVVAIVLILIIVRPFRVGPNVGEVAPNFTLTSTTADPWVESSPAIGADGTVFVGSSDGGSAITNYKVCRGTAPGGESYLTAMGIGLTYTDTGLTNGVTYYYQVTAVNAVGEGPRLSGGVGDAVRQRRSFGVVQRHRGVGGHDHDFHGLRLRVVRLRGRVRRTPSALGLAGRRHVGHALVADEDGPAPVPASRTYTIRLEVKDTGGLTSTVSKQVTVTAVPVDTTKPTLTIVSPSSGAILTSTSVTVSGTASDDVAVRKLELSTDGTTWAPATGTTSWSSTLTLVEGQNTISATAADTSANVATTTVTVTMQTPQGPTPQGLDPMAIGLVAAAVVGVAAVATILVLRKRRKA